jgi:transcriptional regulator with XRE-family HTH domain
MNLVGLRLKERRQSLSISQDQLCGRLSEVSEGAWIPTRHDIYRIEARTRTVSELEVLAIAVALNCEIDWLVMGDAATRTLKQFASQIFRGAAVPPAGNASS